MFLLTKVTFEAKKLRLNGHMMSRDHFRRESTLLLARSAELSFAKAFKIWKQSNPYKDIYLCPKGKAELKAE